MKPKACPQCREPESVIMDKITVRDVILDVCPSCKGVYYDRGEMKKVLAGSLDAETVLSRLPYDGSTLVCPVCMVTMDRISARKGNLYYEMFFCRSCLATFLRSDELRKIKERLSGTVFRQPSAFRPKTIVETTFARPAMHETDTSFSQRRQQQPQRSGPFRPAPAFNQAAPSGAVYSSAATVGFNSAEERNALEHYKKINYEYAAEYEPISASSYLFCLFSNLPLEVYNPRYYFPVVLLFVIAANTLVFALTFKLISNAAGASSLFATESARRALDVLGSFYSTLGLVPAEFFSLKWLLNLFSYQFVHGSFMHFFINMYFLWVFGDNVCDIFYDRKDPVNREASFLGFYLLAGVIGGLAHQIVYRGFETPLVGASGAVAGIMGAYLRLFPGAKFYQVIFFYPFRIPAVYYIWFWVIGQVLMGLGMGAHSMISWPAHLGGFIAGYVLISYFIPYSPEEISPNNA